MFLRTSLLGGNRRAPVLFRLCLLWACDPILT